MQECLGKIIYIFNPWKIDRFDQRHDTNPFFNREWILMVAIGFRAGWIQIDERFKFR